MYRILFLLPLPLISSRVVDSSVNGICSINWDEVDDQLVLDNSVCCDEVLHKDLYRTLSQLTRRKENMSTAIEEVIPLLPKFTNSHLVVTEGILAVSAPGLGLTFCKQRVGRLHVLIQQSPITTEPGFSIPSERAPGCHNGALMKKVGSIVHEHNLPGTLTPRQIIKMFATELYTAFHTRIWLSLSEKRVAFRSNAYLTCEFPVGDNLHLTVFTFQTIPYRVNKDGEIVEDERGEEEDKGEEERTSLPPKGGVPVEEFSIEESSTQLINEDTQTPPVLVESISTLEPVLSTDTPLVISTTPLVPFESSPVSSSPLPSSPLPSSTIPLPSSTPSSLETVVVHADHTLPPIRTVKVPVRPKQRTEGIF